MAATCQRGKKKATMGLTAAGDRQTEQQVTPRSGTFSLAARHSSRICRDHTRKKKKTKGSEPQESSRDSLSSVRLTCLHRQHHSFDSYKASFAHGSPFTCHYVRRKSRMLAVTRNRPRHCALRCWLRSLRGHFPFLFAIGSAQITEVGDWDADDDGASGYTDRCQERKRGSRCR